MGVCMCIEGFSGRELEIYVLMGSPHSNSRKQRMQNTKYLYSFHFYNIFENFEFRLGCGFHWVLWFPQLLTTG